MDWSAQELGLIVPNKSVAYYHREKVYFRNTQTLGFYDMAQGTEETPINIYSYCVSVDDTGVYFWDVNQNRFLQIHLEMGRSTTIQAGGDFFNYNSGNLDYTGIASNNKGPCHVINRLNLESGKTPLLFEEANEFFDFDGNWLNISFKQMREQPKPSTLHFLMMWTVG